MSQDNKLLMFEYASDTCVCNMCPFTDAKLDANGIIKLLL